MSEIAPADPRPHIAVINGRRILSKEGAHERLLVIRETEHFLDHKPGLWLGLEPEQAIHRFVVKRNMKMQATLRFQPGSAQNKRTSIILDLGKHQALLGTIVISAAIQERLKQPE